MNINSSISEQTASKMAELELLESCLDNRSTLYLQKKVTISEIEQDYSNQIREESKKKLFDKLGWTCWWFWLILFFTGIIIFQVIESVIQSKDPAGSLNSRELILSLRRVSHLFFGTFWVALISKIIYNAKLKKELVF